MADVFAIAHRNAGNSRRAIGGFAAANNRVSTNANFLMPANATPTQAATNPIV